jgi:hypothetical protein
MGQAAGFLGAAAFAVAAIFGLIRLQDGGSEGTAAPAAPPPTGTVAATIPPRAHAPVMAAGGVIPAGSRQGVVLVVVRPGQAPPEGLVRANTLPHLLVKVVTQEIEPGVSVDTLYRAVRLFTGGRVPVEIVDLR